jgi:hypothetical protein
METSELRDHVVAGPEVQVVGVAENDGRPEPPQLGGVDRFHGRLRPDRHERRREHLAVSRAEDAGPRGPVVRTHAERALERRGSIVHSTSMASPKE